MWIIEILYIGILLFLYFIMYVYGVIFREKRVDRVGEINMYKVYIVYGLIWIIFFFLYLLKMKVNFFEIFLFCKLIILNWLDWIIDINFKILIFRFGCWLIYS